MVHRSKNSHQLKVDALPFVARLRREPPLSSADERELKEAADCIAGPTGWYSTAGFRPETCARLYRFATVDEADQMQRWINASGIEERPPPKAWGGPQLTVGGGATGQEDVVSPSSIEMSRNSALQSEGPAAVDREANLVVQPASLTAKKPADVAIFSTEPD